jgi:4-hydroxythreonine-4-phosphate dehydrogenase
MMATGLPRIAVTMGDPAGVGPEICLRLLAHRPILESCVPIIFGDAEILARAGTELKLDCPVKIYCLEEWKDETTSASQPGIVHVSSLDRNAFKPGETNARTGQASFDYIQAAIDAALAGSVAAVATAPINKEAIHAAGIPFPGHTEMFAARCQSSRWCMMQYSPEITCTFVTVHVGYAEVPRLLTTDRILEVIELTNEAVRTLKGHDPKLVVCGLNPHAGEHGLFGEGEEERIIVPAMELARRKGIQMEGPLPPDTAFLPARRQTTDAFVCMYHDQGHIPVKALAFDSAVNTTLGLPIIRTSVDHGTALDIAWRGQARPDSLYAAVGLAAQLARSKAGLPAVAP